MRSVSDETNVFHLQQMLSNLPPHLSDLRLEWTRRWDIVAPPIRSRDVLFRMMAWRIQCELYGGPDRDLLRRLAELNRRVAKGMRLLDDPQDRLQPGTVLHRDWRGIRHRVTVDDDGFRYEGARYKTLSEIARLITGTRWSGPRFFGLEAGQSIVKQPNARPAGQA